MKIELKYKIIGKSFFFILIFLIVYSLLNQLFLNKTYPLRTNLNSSFSNSVLADKIEGFYDEKKNTIDIIFLGASQCHCSINPIILWDEYKVTSYDMSADQQDLATSYYYLKEAFKTQSPKLVVLEIGQLNYNMGYVSMHFSFDFMKPSINKWTGILKRVKLEERKELLIPMIRYHSRWSELTKEDFQVFTEEKEHKFNGYWAYCVSIPQVPEVDNGEEVWMVDDYLTEYLDAFVELCTENNATLIFLKTPTAIGNTYKGHINFIGEYALKQGIPFLNYNFCGTEIGLNYETDMADGIHMNIYGAEKFTKRLGKDILEEFYFQGNYTEDMIARYNAKSDFYWEAYKEYQSSLTNN